MRPVHFAERISVEHRETRVGHHQRRCLRECFDERISTIGCFNDLTPGALQ
jgi:hypothetical protein